MTTPPFILVGPSLRAWLNFRVSFPRAKTVKMSAAAVTPVDASGIAILHVADVKFGASDG